MKAKLTLLAVAVTALGACSPQAAEPQVMHKAGYWSMGAAYGRCLADLRLPDGGVFTLSADAEGIGFAAKPAKPPPRSGRFRLETDGGGVGFQPTYGASGDFVYYDGVLGAEALAGLREAKAVRIAVDDVSILQVSLAETGVAEVLDGLAACAQGRSGWWGRGAR